MEEPELLLALRQLLLPPNQRPVEAVLVVVEDGANSGRNLKSFCIGNLKLSAGMGRDHARNVRVRLSGTYLHLATPERVIIIVVAVVVRFGGGSRDRDARGGQDPKDLHVDDRTRSVERRMTNVKLTTEDAVADPETGFGSIMDGLSALLANYAFTTCARSSLGPSKTSCFCVR